MNELNNLWQLALSDDLSNLELAETISSTADFLTKSEKEEIKKFIEIKFLFLKNQTYQGGFLRIDRKSNPDEVLFFAKKQNPKKLFLYNSESFDLEFDLENTIQIFSEVESFTSIGNLNKTTTELIASFKNLKDLSLLQNYGSKALFKKLKEFKQLTSLTISESAEKIPDEIFEIGGLKKLIIPLNEISDLPENIEELKFLEELDVSFNPIHYFPSSMYSLSKLKILKIKGLDLGKYNLHNLKKNLPKCQIITY